VDDPEASEGEPGGEIEGGVDHFGRQPQAHEKADDEPEDERHDGDDDEAD
jgi:hypothetical protein